MRIAVTGGAGFIGSHLVDRLVRAELGEVIVVDNFEKGSPDNLQASVPQITIVKSDIRHDPLDAILSGVELVYHLAGVANVRSAIGDPAACLLTNVAGTVNVVNAAYRVGVHHVILASSREVYGDAQSLPVGEDAALKPKNIYGASKVAAEYCCQECAVPVSVVRMANVYGTRDRGRVIPLFIESALAHRPLTIFGGGQVVDFIRVEVVVDALVKAGLGPPSRDPVNIGSGRGIVIEALARRIVELTQSSSELRAAPRNPAEVTGFVADISRAASRFGLPEIDDPLDGLPDVIEFIRWKLAGEASLRRAHGRGGFAAYMEGLADAADQAEQKAQVPFPGR